MIITIYPDYNLYIQIIFVIWILHGVVNIICGLTQAKKLHSDKYGTVEIIYGGIILLLATWVIF